MQRHLIKRETDLQIISDWIEPKASVLDLGCGRGMLLEHLQQTKATYGVGVDVDLSKVQSCVKRNLNVYQGDALGYLAEIPDNFYDWVVLSRMIQEIPDPAKVIDEALRVGRQLAVGFVNHGYWLNRWSILRSGSRPRNVVFPNNWAHTSPYNPVTITDFEEFCRESSIHCKRRVYLRSDWKTLLHRWPNLRAGYAVYLLTRRQ